MLVVLSFEEKAQMTLTRAHNRDNCHFNNYYTYNIAQQGKRGEAGCARDALSQRLSLHARETSNNSNAKFARDNVKAFNT